MKSGLYGDLPATAGGAGGDVKQAGWAAVSAPSLKPPPRRTQALPPPSLARRSAVQQPQSSADRGNAAAQSTINVVGAAGSLAASVQDEYDPAKPNEYEEVCRQREMKRKQEELEEKRRALERQRKDLEARRRASEAAEASAAGGGDVLDVSGDEAYARRARMSGIAAGGAGGAAEGGGEGPSTSGQQQGPSRSGGGNGGGSLTMAQRMMQKMGWKEGQGLGKDGQGIATPLELKKTDQNAGVIVASEPLPGPPPEKRPRPAPTRVLLLRNMVGAGDVDEELEDEVAAECEKYGAVVRVLIFEVAGPASAEEAVRIFVEFTAAESALKCAAQMDGRYFGGRLISATFFDEGCFARQELAQ